MLKTGWIVDLASFPGFTPVLNFGLSTRVKPGNEQSLSTRVKPGNEQSLSTRVKPGNEATVDHVLYSHILILGTELWNRKVGMKIWEQEMQEWKH